MMLKPSVELTMNSLAMSIYDEFLQQLTGLDDGTVDLIVQQIYGCYLACRNRHLTDFDAAVVVVDAAVEVLEQSFDVGESEECLT